MCKGILEPMIIVLSGALSGALIVIIAYIAVIVIKKIEDKFKR